MRISDWSSDVCSSDLLGLGLASFLLTIVMFGVLPKQFQPEQDDDSSTVRVEMVPGTTLEQTQAVVDRVAHLLRQQKIVTSVYQRSFVGSGRVTAQLADDREITSVQFERSEAHTSELQSLMRISYAVFCLKKKQKHT